jgi:hypothetical protein
VKPRQPHPSSISGEDLIDAAHDVLDMSQRVIANGAEPVYASEKMALALFKAAEALAVCDAELQLVLGHAEQGWRHGRWLAGREEP